MSRNLILTILEGRQELIISTRIIQNTDENLSRVTVLMQLLNWMVNTSTTEEQEFIEVVVDAWTELRKVFKVIVYGQQCTGIGRIQWRIMQTKGGNFLGAAKILKRGDIPTDFRLGGVCIKI